VLVPQALEGVAAVGVLYATVRRWFTPAAALLAGAVFALTPIAALMFRFNNPDALLVLLLVVGAYAVTRAIEDGRTRWLVLAGAAVGFGFLAKELQALVVLPAFGLAYLVAGAPRLSRRVVQVVVLGVSTLVAAGWWVAAVVLTPAAARPYIGGSQNNSFWNVLFGYNGFGRLTGNETGSVGGGGVGTAQWGPTGLTRLFNSSFGSQASWLLPAALILLVVGLALTWRRKRTDRTRAAMIVWGGWLLLTGLVFSLAKGIIHPYYTVALAPAIGAVVGIGATMLWRRRNEIVMRVLLAVVIVATAVWSYELLDRTPSWNPWLRTLVLLGGIGLAIAFVSSSLRARAGLALAGAAVIVGLAAPAAYTLSTVDTTHGGAIPSAGPAAASGLGQRGAGAAPGGTAPRNFAGGPPNFGGGRGLGPGAFNGGGTNNGTATNRGGTGIGGLLNGTSVASQLTSLLEQGASGYRWAAATVGANNAASYQLASGEPIMAIGGFNGSDPAPTLAQFEQYVREGKIHYFIAGGGFGGGQGGSNASSAITSWVESNFSSTTVSGVTVYDLTSPTG
jgi:4-amino-4-deoxy-L-arabinose transferase-like glycosyltransferase